MNSYIKTGNGVSLYLSGKIYSVEDSHPKYEAILDAIRAEQFEDIPNMINTARAIAEYVGTDNVIRIDVDAGVITHNGEMLRSYLVQRILNMMSDGFNITPLTAYLSNLLTNPSKRAVDELHGFNEYGQMPITPDGCFIAFKRISGWYDTYTHTVLNKPYALMDDNDLSKLPYTTDKGVCVCIEDGLTTISMPRNKVDDRCEVTCSEGLHFCSQEYLKSFSGDQIVVLKINPADVVSIPVDYNNTKGRCSKYQVLDVLSKEEFEKSMGATSVFNTPVYGDVDDDWVTEDDETDDNGYYYDDNGYYDDDNGYFDDYGNWVSLSDDEIEKTTHPWSSPKETSTFEHGYRDGYRDGRGNEDNRDNFIEDAYNGYVEGYKDGRGHKLKQFK